MFNLSCGALATLQWLNAHFSIGLKTTKISYLSSDPSLLHCNSVTHAKLQVRNLTLFAAAEGCANSSFCTLPTPALWLWYIPGYADLQVRKLLLLQPQLQREKDGAGGRLSQDKISFIFNPEQKHAFNLTFAKNVNNITVWAPLNSGSPVQGLFLNLYRTVAD